MNSCSAEQTLCLRIILEQVKLIQPLWLKYARIWCRAGTRIGFTFFFLVRLIRRVSLLRLGIGFAFLRYAASEKRTLWHFVTEWRNTEIVLARKFENVWSLKKNNLTIYKSKIHCLNILENQIENHLSLCDNKPIQFILAEKHQQAINRNYPSWEINGNY